MRKKVTWLGFSLLLVAAMLIASCTKSTTTTTIATSTTAAGPTVLTVTEGTQTMTYSLAQLQALTAVTGNGGFMGKGGSMTGPYSYQGVALTTLLNAVGGIAEGQSATITGSDNYSQTLTYDQIMNTSNNFSFYNTSGNSVTPQTNPTLAIVYSQGGNPLSSSVGPLELGMLSSQSYLTNGSLWVGSVQSISVAAAATTTSAAAAGPTVLIVTEGSQTMTYSLAQLQALTPVTGNGGFMGKGGSITGPYSYQGVALTTLLNAVGGIAEGQSAKITGSGNYSQTLTYDQIMNTSSNFSFYDTNGNSITPQTNPTLAIVYSQGGNALSSSVGPLELGMLSSQSYLTNGSLWVGSVQSISVAANTTTTP